MIRFDKKEAITKETEDGHSIENSDLAAAEGKIKEIVDQLSSDSEYGYNNCNL